MRVKIGIEKLTITLLLLLLVGTPTYAQYRKNCTVKIFTKGSKKDLAKVRAFITTVDMIVAQILPKKTYKTLQYSVVLIDKNEFKKANVLSQGKNKIRFYLSGGLNIWQNNDAVLSNIIAAIILKKSGISNGENVKVIPLWMTHAILRKVERRQRKIIIPGTISYPGVHALVLSDAKVNWLAMAQNRQPPKEINAHEIFIEASEIILDAVLRLSGGKKLIPNIIELANKGIDSKELFKIVLTKKVYELKSHMNVQDSDIDSSDILKKWLNYNFRLASVNTFTPCNATDAEKLFIKAEVVSYTAKTGEKKDGETEERFCKIEELPEKLDEILNLGSLLINKQRDLIRIAFAIPIPLQDPIYKMQRSLDLLKVAKDSKSLQEGFRTQYLKEKQKFYSVLEKQNKLESYMTKTENSFVPIGYRYHAEINALKEIKKIERQRWPELTDYLDKRDNWHTEQGN